MAGAEEQILDELLSDRRSAADAAVVEIVFDGVADFDPVEAMVQVKAGILSGHDGVLKVRRDARERNEGVAFAIRLALQLRLQSALDLHGGERGSEPPKGDEGGGDCEPCAKYQSDAPSEQAGHATAAAGGRGAGPGSGQSTGYAVAGDLRSPGQARRTTPRARNLSVGAEYKRVCDRPAP